jgi:hypothetical protein
VAIRVTIPSRWSARQPRPATFNLRPSRLARAIFSSRRHIVADRGHYAIGEEPARSLRVGEARCQARPAASGNADGRPVTITADRLVIDTDPGDLI